MKTDKITSGEFSALLFVSSISFIGAVTAGTVGRNYTDAIIAALLVSVVDFFLLLPLILFRMKNPEEKMLRQSKLLCCVYLLFFVYVCIVELSSLIHMMHNTVFSHMNSYVFSLIFLGAAIYCSYLGVETAARCSQIAVGVIAVCGGLIFLASVKHIEFSNFRIPFYDGVDGAANSFWKFMGSSMFLPQCLFVIDDIEEKKDNRKFITKVISALLIAGFVSSGALALVLLCLGGFAQTQEFPMFTLAGFLDLPPLQRLDVFLGIAMLFSSLIKISVTVIAVHKCCKVIFGGGCDSALIISITIIGLLSAFVAGNPMLISNFCLPQLIAVIGIIIGCAVPLFLISAKRKTERDKTDEIP